MAIALAAHMMMKNFLLRQKPLAILSLLTIQERPKSTQMQSLTHTNHLRTCWWDYSRLNIGPLAMAVKPSKTPAA
jgi:hypothetical protein